MRRPCWCPDTATPGTTEDAPDEQEGSCASSGGHERVYRLDVPTRERVTIDLSADFDAALYLRKGACNDEDAEVRCNDDDEPGQKEHSRIDVAARSGNVLRFRRWLRRGVGDLPHSSDHARCADAWPTSVEQHALSQPRRARRATSPTRLDNVNATCGRDAKGVDAPFRFDVPTRARVRFVEKSSEFRPVVHVRRVCEDANSEVACSRLRIRR